MRSFKQLKQGRMSCRSKRQLGGFPRNASTTPSLAAAASSGPRQGWSRISTSELSTFVCVGLLKCRACLRHIVQFFFGARYMWTKEQLAQGDARRAAGVRTDVHPPPPWVKVRPRAANIVPLACCTPFGS